ncbi:YqjF family protein [Kribbella sp. NPDC058245]|uniref:YqjF family protein n=1 Tax=Kribbella sp. NPDC058245 TaxID=3346399 RepID=UPI0036E7F4F4
MAAIWPDAPALRRPRILRQRWLDLTFLHWAVDPAAVAHLFPPGTRPDVFEGRTYVGLVPFRMVDTGLPHGPSVPYVGTFLETNIRLYSIDTTGRRGVIFLSLDANRLTVVAAARTVFALPYRWAHMTHIASGDAHTYTSTLRWYGVRASSTIVVETGPRVPTDPLADFLTARWGLHTHRAGRTWYLPNYHPTWELHSATVTKLHMPGLFPSVGLPEPAGPPDHVLHSPGVPAEFGLPLKPALLPSAARRTGFRPDRPSG